MAEKEKEEVLEEVLEELEEADKEKTEAEEGAEEKDTGSSEEAKTEEDQDSKKEEKEEKEEKEKKGIFNKKKDKKDEQIEELNDRLRRQMAEFDNFRKRSEKEKSQMFDMGAKSIVEKVLPVIDNFERGLLAVPEEDKDNAFVDGMDKVYKQMLTMLAEAGVEPIEAVGKEFDPNLHNAVMHVEDEEAGENTIVEEFQKGYMYRDSVVRHSMVKVAN